MIVVSDASPLINLAIIDHLFVLPALYSRVVLPSAVWNEIVEKGQGQPGEKEISTAVWVSVISCEKLDLVEVLHIELHLGESEAIALAVQLNADLLLMDENLGRLKARSFGLHMIGLLGILIDAKRKGLIEAVTPLMERLRTEANFRIGEALFQEVQRLARE